MKILMCISDAGGEAAAGFETKIGAVAGDRIDRVCRNVDSLQGELRKPWAAYGMVILFAGSTAELEQFVSLQELMDGVPVLLILPGSGKEIFELAHRLRPRFLSFADSDFTDFLAVLQKMLRNREKRPPLLRGVAANSLL
jgi:hypothetical protein